MLIYVNKRAKIYQGCSSKIPALHPYPHGRQLKNYPIPPTNLGPWAATETRVFGPTVPRISSWLIYCH